MTTCVHSAQWMASLRRAMPALVLAISPGFSLAAAEPATPRPEETVQLNVFEVREDSATSYGALESNSLMAFRVDLTKAPATAQIFTQTFMDDIAATSIEEVLTGYSGTVTANTGNNAAVTDMPGDRDGQQGMSIRGVAAGDIKRDGFIGPMMSVRTASGSSDNFSVERVEVVEGPQSILYGSVGGGGLINSVSKQARFGQRRGSLRYLMDRYGTKRATLDYNFGAKGVAARVALLGAENATNRYKIGNEIYGAYVQVAAKVLPSTTLRLSTEQTDSDARFTFKPNLNNFMAATDRRRGLDARYLMLTNQVSDLRVLGEPLTYGNLESLGSWWSSERIKNHWNSLILESNLPHGFAAQFTAVYSETLDNRVTDGRSLLPARGLPNAGANPFDVTAIQIGSPVQLNVQRDRTKGARVAFVHDGRFRLLKFQAHSQTAFGGQVFHRGPRWPSNGIAYAYYQADANWEPIINRNVTLDYGRVPLQFLYFPVQNGIPSKPVFRPGQRKVTYNGLNYVLLPRIAADASRATPANPYGLIPNNPTTANPNGFSGGWNNGGETHTGSVFLANFTDWADGRLTTLLGYTITRFESLDTAAGSSGLTPMASHPGWQAGINYRVLTWLRAYAVAGTSERAESTQRDIFGGAIKNPQAKAPVPEFGLYLRTADDRYNARLSFSPKTESRNESARQVNDSSYLDAINPNGINGRVGGDAANTRANANLSLQSAQAVLTASPTRNWRMRMNVTKSDGELLTSVAYTQVYNDAFYATGNIVTYKDGTPLLVDPAGGNGARTQQLTIAMINDPTSRYYASPDPASGRITNSTLRTALTTIDPAHGTAATGEVGLPMSKIQYNFRSPYPDGLVTIYKEGEKITGMNEYTFNFQNNYTFSSGALKGVGVLGDVQTYFKNRAYYVNYPDSTGSLLATRVTRQLYRLPNATVLNLGFSYRRKLPWFGEKYTWSTQLNVRNVMNHYRVWVVPSPANGSILNARFSAQPRQYVWTNTLSF